MANTPIENEQGFREWLKSQKRQDGMRVFSDNAVAAYCYALRKDCEAIEYIPVTNFFLIGDYMNFDEKSNNIKKYPEFAKLDQDGNGTLSAAFDLYHYYLKNGKHSVAPDIKAAFYLTKKSEIEKAAAAEAATNAKNSGTRMSDFHYHEVVMKSIQRVYYGAPGTGKSYTVNKFLSEQYPNKEDLQNHVKRVIFHPAYSYGEFVGCIKPIIAPDRPMEYVFTAGPFTDLLKAAFLNN